MASRLKRGFAGLLLIVAALVVIALILAIYQGKREPEGTPYYVSLGSSFAAGAGLGSLQEDSPTLCARSVGGYPQLLSKAIDRPIVDRSCGGAKTSHLLNGGQFFQGPQIASITSETTLVTVTVGGNDINYVGDLSMLAARQTNSLFGRLVRAFWDGPEQVEERDYQSVQDTLVSVGDAIRSRSPQANIVFASYPAIVPENATCAEIVMSANEAAEMHEVGDRLALATKIAADEVGAIFVDMNALGSDHHACSSQPWVSGWLNSDISPFHPTAAGANATASAIEAVLAAS